MLRWVINSILCRLSCDDQDTVNSRGFIWFLVSALRNTRPAYHMSWLHYLRHGKWSTLPILLIALKPSYSMMGELFIGSGCNQQSGWRNPVTWIHYDNLMVATFPLRTRKTFCCNSTSLKTFPGSIFGSSCTTRWRLKGWSPSPFYKFDVWSRCLL